ncbi:RluA family pseudouridine synthase [Candidatus Saccharibacteria bacterium]|nr:RluA family pseudouridine synthase [Candidatus Saccharibacteria bacterium]
MAAVSSRDILEVLRAFKIADDSNVPRNIESIKVSNPSPINMLAVFRFDNQPYYILIDDTADDDVNYILNQMKSAKAGLNGQLIANPKDESITYGMPFKGKECYLFKVMTDKKRLDSELAKRYPDRSRGVWQKYIKAGFVSVNDKVIISPKHEINDSDNIAIDIPESPDYSDTKLPIIYIDDNVIVIDKPSGVLTHAKGPICEEFTVADFFRQYTSYNLDTNRPGIVHRLDRDTSGLLIGARNHETAVSLQKQFADRKVKKIYYAVVKGVLKHKSAKLDLPIGRNLANPSSFRVDPTGKQAITEYQVIDETDKMSLVELRPKTGRTHQLRVHLSYLNAPILGDRVYGKKADRLYLHAAKLEITIPNGKRHIFESKLPSEFIKIFPKAANDEEYILK